jgi:hypothetical protein
MACRTGCPTQDHGSWGDCLVASNIQMNAGDAGSNKAMSNKKWTNELDAYAKARSQGIQPAGTRLGQIREAEKASETLGRAYSAETMPPAKRITKAHGEAFKEVGI